MNNAPRPVSERIANAGIAVVGIGCRFPGGVESPEDYWRLLRDGVDAISETPPDRWSRQQFYFPDDVRPGKTQSRWGGFVEGIELFDPQLFGISPKEAASMDPQQRMLMEVAWRSLEDAGIPTSSCAGQSVGVFVGISSFDYAVAGLSYADRGVIGTYNNTGSSSSIAANRISYCFDLRGPSLAVDTACSSSLVALHLACESLARGESRMALCGGVNALLLPDFYVGFSQLGVLSPDGRCKTFDARANGYVRSEGAGMVVLKPLDAAIRDGDRIYCVIRGTAVNQDGHTPGLTVPSGEAQQRLVSEACRRAGVDPAEIQYVEAHGTGTPVGDPIEAAALSAVLSPDRRRDDRFLIGSVKTNIGHLEAGAGVASLIKVALSMRHREIPRHLHLEEPNPAIDFDELGMQVPRQTVEWPRPESRLLAGINGFGYGGANAHVIVEEAPASHQPDSSAVVDPDTDTGLRLESSEAVAGGPPLKRSDATGATPGRLSLLPISARSPDALADLAGRYADYLVDCPGDVSMNEIASMAAHRRGHFEYRHAIVGDSLRDWAERCRELQDEMQGGSNASASTGRGTYKPDVGLLFVCCGQGTQWWGMGRGLYQSDATYRETIDRCDGEFSKYVSWSLTEELLRDESESRIQRTSIAQPAIFALQIALANCWAKIGVTPSAVVGHSVGEIAAAHIAGALDFEDACRVAVERGRSMDLATSSGAMLAVGLTEAESEDWIRKLGVEVSVAAINGPTSVTLSGRYAEIEKVAVNLEAGGVFCKRLAVEYAFHSAQMEPVREDLLRSLASIQPRATSATLISTVTGEAIDGECLGADYWWQNVRRGVRFADAINAASNAGYEVAVELGPHPTLTFAINECCQAMGNAVTVIPSLRRDVPDDRRFAESIAMAYELGVEVDWRGIHDVPTTWVTLPGYPFQRQRLWSESEESRLSRLSASHPLLGRSNQQPSPSWRSRIDLNVQQMFRDHRVRGNCVFPAAAMVETALAAATELQTTSPLTLGRFRFRRAALLDDNRPLQLQTTFDESARVLRIASRVIDESNWIELALVESIEGSAEIEPLDASLETVRSRLAEQFDGERLYDYCRRLGLDYESQFRGIRAGVRRNGEALAEIQLESPESFQYVDGADPAVLDSCFHTMVAADPNFDHSVRGLFLPAEIRRVQLLRPVPQHAFAHARIIAKSDQRLLADLDIYDESGNPCLLVRGFLSQRVRGGGEDESVRDWLYGYRWIPSELDDAKIVSVNPLAPPVWLVLCDQEGLGSEIAAELRRRGDRVVEVEHGDQFARRDADHFLLNPQRPEDFEALIEATVSKHSASPVHWVYLWGLNVSRTPELNDAALQESTILTTLAPMYLVQAWERLCPSRRANLSVVTAAAQPLDDQLVPIAMAQTPLVGMTRVIISEMASFRTRLVDLADASGKSHTPHVDELIREFLSDSDPEDEVLYRDRVRYAHRFLPQHNHPIPSDAARHMPCRLEVDETKGIDGLKYRSQAVQELAPNEVEIEVAAAGLNFSDVMKSLGLYPSDEELAPALGAECAGRITRIGKGVKDWAVGDEVMAIAPGSFATHVVVSAMLVAAKPSNLSFEQAAAVPIAFLTAAHSLDDCARIRPGETVLVHAASGGVGLAALQIARRAGAKVFATAGTEEKRDYVLAHGAEMVMDSRSLQFADQIMEATDGTGVDAVLNSLPGAAIVRGLESLKVGGRFLELGKRDIYEDQALGMYRLRNNLAFFAIDLDQLFKTQPAEMGRKLRELSEWFERGELSPLPIEAMDADETDAAFRFMQQARHIGKVVVRYSERPQSVHVGDHGPMRIAGEGTYWIVGGLGGFGIEVARWLADHGARTLVLSSRRAEVGDEANEVIASLKSRGVDVRVLPVDVADASAVDGVLGTIRAELPPLRGVFHAAMVLQDCLLVDLDRETLQGVLRSKVFGGWNLHQATKDLDLDHFVLFSSLSSVFGHAGQANYSAANAFLDGLAHHRRWMGLPACVINWGHLGDVGYLARHEQLSERLRRQGVLSFSLKQAFESLQHILQHQLIQASVLRIDWSVWRGLGVSGEVSPRFAHLIHDSSVVEHAIASADQIRQATGEKRRELVDQMMRHKVSALLGLRNDQLDARRCLIELGLDSLMAVELRNWIESQIRIGLPIAQLMRDTTLADLVDLICDGVVEDQAAPPESDAASTAEVVADGSGSQPSGDAKELLEALPGMSPDEVTNLLSQLLREQESASDERS